MTCHIFGALAHFCKTMHKTLLSKIVFIEEAVCKKKERTICFFDNFQKPSEPHSMGKYILTLQLDFSKNPVLKKVWHWTVWQSLCVTVANNLDHKLVTLWETVKKISFLLILRQNYVAMNKNFVHFLDWDDFKSRYVHCKCLQTNDRWTNV